jgi:L-alanine-DL-glutamate epimerase-like enolase superfamily enzyme
MDTIQITAGGTTRALARPLRVSHTSVTEVDVVTLEIRGPTATGSGEVTLGPWTRERPDAVRAAALEAARDLLGPDPFGPAHGPVTEPGAIAAAVFRHLDRGCSPTAVMLAEMAVLDQAARRAGQPLHRFLALPRPVAVPLWRTVSVGEPVPRDARRLKVKLGGPGDGEVLAALARGADGSRQVVLDVNRGWSAEDVERHRDALLGLRPDVLEDPVADPALLERVRAGLPGVPVVLDEGVRTPAEAEDAARRADGANVKLLKSGGLFAARAALERLGQLGAVRMLGCFVETERAIAYAAQLSGLADWTDLDGHLLLSGEVGPDVLELEETGHGVPTLAG